MTNFLNGKETYDCVFFFFLTVNSIIKEILKVILRIINIQKKTKLCTYITQGCADNLMILVNMVTKMFYIFYYVNILRRKKQEEKILEYSKCTD